MNDSRFDELMRARHAQALEHLSPRTRAQLHNRLQAAFAGPRTRPRWRAWVPVAAVAAALALWLPWRSTQPPASPGAVAPVADDTLATLDETPDFYLWLASDDAVALASE